MAKVAIAGITLSLLLVPAVAAAQVDRRVGAPPVVSGPGGPGPMGQPYQANARWAQVPGGASAYRRPDYGYQLPRYWMTPSFYIANSSAFGLPAPAAGFGWSRYYDDYVLTDRFGRVYDVREGAAYDGREDYADSYGYQDDRRDAGRPARQRRNDGIGGSVAGAVVGGVAGNLIGGRGNRLAGTLIGGGVGAIAGGAIERSATYDSRVRQDYYGQGRQYQNYGRPHWDMGHGQRGYSYGYDSSAYGYGGYESGGTTVTTVVVDSAPSVPIVTRSVSYQTEYVSVPVRHRVVHHYYHPRPKLRCGCGS